MIAFRYVCIKRNKSLRLNRNINYFVLLFFLIVAFSSKTLPGNACSCGRTLRAIRIVEEAHYIPENSLGILVHSFYNLSSKSKNPSLQFQNDLIIIDESNTEHTPVFKRYDSEKFKRYWLVSPKGGFKQGKQYTFLNFNSKYLGQSDKGPDKFVVTVGQKIVSKNYKSQLIIDSESSDYIAAAMSPSCSVLLWAKRYPIENHIT